MNKRVPIIATLALTVLGCDSPDGRQDEQQRTEQVGDQAIPSDVDEEGSVVRALLDEIASDPQTIHLGQLEDRSIRREIGDEDPVTRAALNQIILLVLNSPKLKSSREFYGTADDTRCALVSSGDFGIPWPDWYDSELVGIDLVHTDAGQRVPPANRRLLGIRIDRFDLDPDVDIDDFPMFGGPIQVALFNAGGDPEGAIVNGSANVGFNIEWIDDSPVLSFAGLTDY